LAVVPRPNDELLTVSQVAERLQVTPQTIRNWIDGGVLSAARIGRGFRIRREDVDELLARASAQTGSLASRRDVWAPTTTSLPRAAQPAGLPSLWGGAGLATPLPSESEN
jgi:excisionase family DNA binding protein